MAVVHSHSPSVVPYSVSRRTRLQPVCHMSGFLGAGAPLFEIRDVVGDGSDLLIRNAELGAALARSLGGAHCVLMRGHGSTVVAPTLKLAVYRAIYAEVNARLQTQAIALGEPAYLTPAEAAAAAATTEGQVERPWQLWQAAAQRARAAS
jgi:HCOMODA/2-hydroxy-3-carboxy-muconic semialdehyde decarboxylase